MKKQNKLEALFPNGKVPEVNEFNRSLDKMSKEGRNHLREKIYKIAFTVWSTLPKKHQKFIEEVIVHDRQSYVDFIIEKTVMTCLRCPLRFPVLFIRMLHLTEVVERTAQTSINHLSMSVSKFAARSVRLPGILVKEGLLAKRYWCWRGR